MVYREVHVERNINFCNYCNSSRNLYLLINVSFRNSVSTSNITAPHDYYCTQHVDSIRDVRKYSEPMGDDIDLKNNPSAEAVVHMKLFRAQRNFYIAGFALFLFL